MLTPLSRFRGEGQVSTLVSNSRRQEPGHVQSAAVRMLPTSAFALFVATCCSQAAIFAEEQVIKLGGIRSVTATILDSDETYRITVEMLPVKAFDPATNKRLNLIKSRAYAALALAKHLGTAKSTGLSFTGLKSGKTAPAAISFAWSPKYRERA